MPHLIEKTVMKRNETLYFSDNIRFIMQKYNLSATQLAKKINCDPTTVTGYLKNSNKSPDIQIVRRIAKTYGYKMDDFVFEKLREHTHILAPKNKIEVKLIFDPAGGLVKSKGPIFIQESDENS